MRSRSQRRGASAAPGDGARVLGHDGGPALASASPHLRASHALGGPDRPALHVTPGAALRALDTLVAGLP